MSLVPEFVLGLWNAWILVIPMLILSVIGWRMRARAQVAYGGAGKTQIMYRANLSFKQLEKYLRLILEIDLSDETPNNGRKVYDTTHKGINFLQRYARA